MTTLGRRGWLSVHLSVADQVYPEVLTTFVLTSEFYFLTEV